MKLALLATAAAANGIPSLATHGVAIRGPNAARVNGQGSDAKDENEAVFAVTSTAGTDVMVCKIAIWGYHVDTGLWVRWKSLNAAADIAETSTDSIKYAEVVTGIRHFDRLYAEIVSIGGTGTSVKVDMFLRQARPGAP